MIRIVYDIVTAHCQSARSAYVVPWSNSAREQSAARRNIRQEPARRPEPHREALPFPTPRTCLTYLPQDSMFYQFRIKENNFQWCYIEAVVPTAQAAAEGGKSFVGSGDLYNIQIWNVSAPQKLESMSWNTRPERVELMGTVAWLNERERMKVLDWEDGWQMKPQAPRFPCNGHKWMTFEVACDNCTLEFDQIFSDPAMGKSGPNPSHDSRLTLSIAFDLLQLA